MSERMVNTLTVILMISLLTIEIVIFGNLFPWTGLQAIIVTPMIYGICIAIIISGTYLTRKANYKLRIAIWAIIFVINSLIAASMYPQEFRPTVLNQIGYTFKVVKEYEKVNINDPDMALSDKAVKRGESNALAYREAASGANGGKTGGGCGCN